MLKTIQNISWILLLITCVISSILFNIYVELSINSFFILASLLFLIPLLKIIFKEKRIPNFKIIPQILTIYFLFALYADFNLKNYAIKNPYLEIKSTKQYNLMNHNVYDWSGIKSEYIKNNYQEFAQYHADKKHPVILIEKIGLKLLSKKQYTEEELNYFRALLLNIGMKDIDKSGIKYVLDKDTLDLFNRLVRVKNE